MFQSKRISSENRISKESKESDPERRFQDREKIRMENEFQNQFETFGNRLSFVVKLKVQEQIFIPFDLQSSLKLDNDV